MTIPAPGELYIDCACRLCLCISIDKDSVCGYILSETDGNNIGNCSLYHCGLEWIEQNEKEFVLFLNHYMSDKIGSQLCFTTGGLKWLTTKSGNEAFEFLVNYDTDNSETKIDNILFFEALNRAAKDIPVTYKKYKKECKKIEQYTNKLLLKIQKLGYQ